MTNTPFMNTYAEMRKFEKAAERAEENYRLFKVSAWLKQVEQFRIQAERLKRTLDSNANCEDRKEVEND